MKIEPWFINWLKTEQQQLFYEDPDLVKLHLVKWLQIIPNIAGHQLDATDRVRFIKYVVNR